MSDVKLFNDNINENPNTCKKRVKYVTVFKMDIFEKKQRAQCWMVDVLINIDDTSKRQWMLSYYYVY